MQIADRQWLRLIALAAGASGWVLLILAGPWLGALSDAGAGVVYLAGSLVCHQQADRSFHLGGAQLPVCARCLGLYAGAALGAAAWVVAGRRHRRAWSRPRALVLLAASGAPTALTVASAWAGVGDPANPWRAALAVPLGMAAGVVAGAAATEHLK